MEIDERIEKFEVHYTNANLEPTGPLDEEDTEIMAEFRIRRPPDPSGEYQRVNNDPSLPPSILRQHPSTIKKSTSFAPCTVFDGADRRHRARRRAFIVLVVLGFLVVGCFFLTVGTMHEHYKMAGVPTPTSGQLPNDEKVQIRKHDKKKAEIEPVQQTNSVRIVNEDKCQFRTYPSNRLYGLFATKRSQPSFLSDATYIRGKWPIILNPSSNEHTATKLCINTTSWENLVDDKGVERLPFTDGHNPSIISLSSIPYNSDHVRIDFNHLKTLVSVFPSGLGSLFMGISVFGSGQCKFGLTPQDVTTYRFSALEEVPNGKRAIVSIHAPPDSNTPFETLTQTTLLLERDAKYGTNRRALSPQTEGAGYAKMHQEFDDPRLFFYQGKIWVLYRNGPLFGYNDQIHNPIHFEEASAEDIAKGVKFIAYVKASETVRVCCGRNIALISEETGIDENGLVKWVENPTLKALTWVDPVTVVDVDLGDVAAKLNNRRLEEALPTLPLPYNRYIDNNHRRLKGKQEPKSNIHGTNGFMIPFQSTGELLGIAHFHRPEHRVPSEYALHGHHYTHVFFTIARKGESNTNDRQFKLKRLSNEFLFQAQYMPIDGTKLHDDGDVIQFASGLDLVGSDKDGTLVISYGINDCEGAAFTMDMSKVQEMLMEVGPGLEVVDLMKKVGEG